MSCHRLAFSRTALSVLLLAAALAPALPAAAQQAAATPALAEIIAKNLAAKGGADAWRDIETVRVTGTMTLGGQMSAPFTWEWKAPNHVRSEFTVQGQTGIQAYDGETGWMIMPFAGQTEAQVMPAEQASRMAEQSDFTGPFVDSEAKGYQLAYDGEEEVGGKAMHVVEVTHPNGEETTLYLDPETGLEAQSRAVRRINGQRVEAVTRIGDYRQVGPIVLPHRFDVEMPGSPGGGQSLVFETVELGAEVPDSRFVMPGEGAQSGAPGEGPGDVPADVPADEPAHEPADGGEMGDGARDGVVDDGDGL